MNNLPISVFFPCFNDDQTIGGLVVQTNKILGRLTTNFEIIVVNDGSTDKSLEVLKNTLKEVPVLRIVNHSRNRGYGAALRSGFQSAKKELVFYTDGDGQYDVSELPLLLSCMTADIDVVNGIKLGRQDEWFRIFLGNAYKSVMRNLFDLPIYDVDCDFRLIRNRLVKIVDLKINSGAVCIELVKKLKIAGARFREVSVHHYPRRYGASQFFRVLPILKTARDLVTLLVQGL